MEGPSEEEERPIVFSEALEATLSQVLPTTDPMESADFSVVDYVNKMFPNEQSLSNVELAESKLKQQIRKLDEEILDAVREQTQSGAKGRQDLEDAKQAIGQLGTRIREIKEQAEQSETMVQEICRDIKSLDYAKRNLTTGITSLKRLHMLVSGVDQLQEMTRRRQFREAASMLEAVQQLKEHFHPYSALEKIRELEGRIVTAQEGLKKKVMEEFENMHEQRQLQTQDPSHSLGAHSVMLDHLADACLAAEALGPDVRDEVVKMFYTPYLVEYRTFFRSSTEAGKLDGTVRRYSWLRKQLRQYDDEFTRIFPASWSVAELFCAEFCRVTRNDLQAALDEASAREALDVPALLHALNKTIEFEKELTLRFRREKQQLVMGEDEEEDLGDTESSESEGELEPPDQTSAAYIKWKYKRHAQLKRREERALRRDELARRMEERQKQLREQGTDVDGFKFAGAISQAFEQYLYLYLGEEDKAMKEMIDRFAKEKDTSQLRDDIAAATALVGDKSGGAGESDHAKRVRPPGPKVLPSSTQLFIHFKTSLGRCRSITTGQTLFSLYRLFKKYLGIYCEQLSARIPRGSSAAVSLAMALKGMDKDGGAANGPLRGRSNTASGVDAPFQRISLSDEDEALICMIINTAEYCGQTIEQLDGSVRKIIDEAFQKEVDMSVQQDQFNAVISQGVKALVQGLETKIEPALVSFTKMPWGTWEAVGDQSEHVNSIHVALSQTVPLIGSMLSKSYFRYFCDRFAASFIPRFVGAVYRCKRISEVGASQILLDAQALKTVLLDVPAMGLSHKSDSMAAPDGLASTEKAASAGYIRFVNKEMGRAELLLKVICTPPESLMDSYEALVPDGSEADFVRIMELKGMKKTDQERFMESFVKGGKNLKKLFSLS